MRMADNNNLNSAMSCIDVWRRSLQEEPRIQHVRRNVFGRQQISSSSEEQLAQKETFGWSNKPSRYLRLVTYFSDKSLLV